MTGFFIKKAFFDGWDNLFSLAGLNLGYLAIFFLFAFLPLSAGVDNLLLFAATGVGILAFSLWHSLTSLSMAEVADYRTLGFKEVFARFPMAAIPGLAVGALNLLLWFAIVIAIPFYLMQKSFIGLFLASLLFWVCLVALIAEQYFLPLMARRRKGVISNAKASLTLFLDNIGFSFVLFFHTIFTLVISILLAFLAPGFSGVALSGQVAVKLLLKKYLWLESDGTKDRKRVPWKELLEEDQEMVGKRTLKGMI
ncbi:MAG: hypothetical protein FD137_2473, partial [Spirochaetes bacterium]